MDRRHPARRPHDSTPVEEGDRLDDGPRLSGVLDELDDVAVGAAAEAVAAVSVRVDDAARGSVLVARAVDHEVAAAIPPYGWIGTERAEHVDDGVSRLDVGDRTIGVAAHHISMDAGIRCGTLSAVTSIVIPRWTKLTTAIS